MAVANAQKEFRLTRMQFWKWQPVSSPSGSINELQVPNEKCLENRNQNPARDQKLHTTFVLRRKSRIQRAPCLTQSLLEVKGVKMSFCGRRCIIAWVAINDLDLVWQPGPAFGSRPNGGSFNFFSMAHSGRMFISLNKGNISSNKWVQSIRAPSETSWLSFHPFKNNLGRGWKTQNLRKRRHKGDGWYFITITQPPTLLNLCLSMKEELPCSASIFHEVTSL